MYNMVLYIQKSYNLHIICKEIVSYKLMLANTHLELIMHDSYHLSGKSL